MTDTRLDAGPLTRILPDPDDRASWRLVAVATAADTHERVAVYAHQVTGRALRLDTAGRVYGEDAQGVIRLFGRGGPMALAVALNAVYDGADHARPVRVVLPDTADRALR
jgi:hypothetical protein